MNAANIADPASVFYTVRLLVFMRYEPPPLRVGTPCPKQWEEMRGDAKRRFCDQCQLHVHNLSAMSRRERDRFVQESGGRGCIAYQLRPDGTMMTPTFWSGVL